MKRPWRSFEAHSLGQLAAPEEGDLAECLNEARFARMNGMGGGADCIGLA